MRPSLKAGLHSYGVYTQHMLERAQLRVLPVLTKTADHAPMVTACCNACRVCVQTNALAVALAALGGATATLARSAKGFFAKRSY